MTYMNFSYPSQSFHTLDPHDSLLKGKKKDFDMSGMIVMTLVMCTRKFKLSSTKLS